MDHFKILNWYTSNQSSEVTSPSAIHHTSTQYHSASSSPYSSNSSPSRLALPISVPQTTLQLDSRNPLALPPAVQLQKQQGAANSRTPVQLVTSSHTGTVADLQCKSESKPIYFKSILNRLRAPKRPEIELIRKPPPRHMECRSESKVLNLRTKNKVPSATEMAPWLVPQSHQVHHLSRRENARYLTPSSPNKSYSRTAVEQWRDMIRENYQHHLPPYLLNSYLTAERATTTPDPSSSAAYLFFKTPSQYLHQQQPQPTTARSVGLNGGQLLLSDVNQTTKNFVIEVSEVDRKLVSRNDVPVTRIILKPLARAKAGQGGVAISSPLSTAYIKRGDYVEIEYLPEATADVGEGGVALSRPELVIHFIDRRRR